ncbi:hypothetical protein GGR50DRAFT_650403 [Xylaria sp. CBS 124048]|nr:hypothetical protein GGR50DRAFT_650403 [Xylaria sp. CBS 124048]
MYFSKTSSMPCNCGLSSIPIIVVIVLAVTAADLHVMDTLHWHYYIISAASQHAVIIIKVSWDTKGRKG